MTATLRPVTLVPAGLALQFPRVIIHGSASAVLELSNPSKYPVDFELVCPFVFILLFWGVQLPAANLS